MPRSETSTKINENDRSAVRNLASLQSPVSGDKNKIQSIRDINRTDQINIRKKILLNADQFRAEQTDIRKKILLNADKIEDIDVFQNDRKHVGQQKSLKSQGTAIKMPHSETSIGMNKQDRNAIRNATSLQNLYDFDKSANNKLHFKDKLNDSVRSRTKPVIRSLNSIQLVDQFVHKKGKTVLKSKQDSYSGSISIQKIQDNKGHLKEVYQEKANSNSSNKYVKKKRQFMKRTFKNQKGSNRDNVINKNDQTTYTNQILSDVGSHTSNNENIIKKPIEQTYANAENNNRQLPIDYYSVDYVSKQPMKEVFKDSNHKRNQSENSQTKQTLEFQEIVQGNDRLSITHLNKPNNGNYKSKRTEISPLKINTTSYIQTTVPVKHPPQQLKTVIPEIKRNVDFKNNDLQNNQQISTNKQFGEIKGKRNITPDVRYHNDIAPELQVTKQLHLPRSKGAIENENTYKTSIISDTYDRNEQSNSRGGQIRMQTFKGEPVDGGNSNIPTSKKESIKLSERNKKSTNDVILKKSVGKLTFDKSFATDKTQDLQKSPHVQQSKRRNNNVKFKPIQNNIHFVKKRLPKRNTDRITTTKSIKLTDRRHQVNTDVLPSISVQSSDKSDIQNGMLENLSTRTSNHRENNQS
ncbi:unnamed protein product [Mytilus edulis]|uniref:Uncharacterized protein n=1 Tax=Mytilus edulis TaxID=6550 RepID=A0A8S3TIA1_MYTED|nr:unnamed protein product [Mytilus edulis]